MAGFGGVDEKRRGARTGQGGCNLVADVTRLAHAQDHNPSLAREDQLAGADKMAVNTLRQGAYCLSFRVYNRACSPHQLLRIRMFAGAGHYRQPCISHFSKPLIWNL